MPEKPDALIQGENLCKTYRLGKIDVPAVCGVDFRINRGEFVAVMGASGSGKSTLLHLIGCLDTPTAGRVIVDGIDYAGLDDARQADIRNQKIGFVFQTFNLIPNRNVIENIELPLVYNPGPKKDYTAKVDKILSDLSMSARAKHFPNELSGGERQRVAIGRALINDPPILLADEPTGNLDTKTSQEIMKIFKQLNEKCKVTIILVTHENDIAAFAGRKMVMRDGKIISDERAFG